MKKFILTLSLLLLFPSFSYADFIDFTNLNKTIGSIFDPVLNFFQQVRDYISSFFSFLWDLIEGLYYGFNTIVVSFYNSFMDITGLSFISDNSDSISSITSLLGTSGSLLFFSLFYVCMCLVIVRFIYSLIPFFKSGRK